MHHENARSSEPARQSEPTLDPISLTVFNSRRSWRKFDAALIGALWLGGGSRAHAQLRLRGDALVQTRSPVGLVILNGTDELRPWLDAETVTWLGATSGDSASATGDVVTLTVRARDPSSGSELRAGRFVMTMGALRPVHVDGARALARASTGATVEAFGGVPIVRRFAYDDFDWTAGGRVGQTLGTVAAFGAAYGARWRGGAREGEEAGADLALTPSPWLTAASRATFDVETRTPTEALASISAQKKDVRGELFTTHRTPSRLLPRTSLFSMLGDFAATSMGATARYRAFPRLELVTTGSVQRQGENVGGQGLGRVTLALDDAWAGTLGLEMRRVDVGGARWTGARAIASLPLPLALRVSTELEIVRLDEPSSMRRGSLWPWALGAVAWSSSSGWELATGIEASAGPESGSEIHALGRISYAFTPSPRVGIGAR